MALTHAEAMKMIMDAGDPENGVKLGKNTRLHLSYNDDCCVVGYGAFLVRIRKDGYYLLSMGYDEWSQARANAVNKYSPARLFRHLGQWRLRLNPSNSELNRSAHFELGACVDQNGSFVDTSTCRMLNIPRQFPNNYWSADSGELTIPKSRGTDIGEQQWQQLVYGEDGERIVRAENTVPPAPDSLASEPPLFDTNWRMAMESMWTNWDVNRS
jgi:hypothetical protein